MLILFGCGDAALEGDKMNAPIQSAGQADPWSRRRARKAARLARIAPWMKGHVLETGAIVEALQTLLEPGDAVALEGDNQKQADFLSRSLVQVDPAKIHDLHLLISSVSRPEHLTLFERGIARKVDLAYAGPQSVRLAQLARGRKARDRRHSHLCRAVRADVRGPDARRGTGLCRAGRPPGQPLHRPEHRGHADHRRGDGFPRRGGRRAGQRNRGRAAARGHPGVLGRRRRHRGQPLRGRAFVHARPEADQRGANPDRHAGDPRNLRASRRDHAQSRHRFRHRGDRAAAADVRREARPARQDLPQLGPQPAPHPHPGDRERLGGKCRLLRE